MRNARLLSVLTNWTMLDERKLPWRNRRRKWMQLKMFFFARESSDFSAEKSFSLIFGYKWPAFEVGRYLNLEEEGAAGLVQCVGGSILCPPLFISSSSRCVLSVTSCGQISTHFSCGYLNALLVVPGNRRRVTGVWWFFKEWIPWWQLLLGILAAISNSKSDCIL